MSNAVLAATIKAYDEFTRQFQGLQQELRKTDQEQKKTAQGAEQLSRSTDRFLQAIGQVGALYAFQQGLQAVMATGREFQLTIKQAQAVTGDFSSTLRDQAMASTGSKTPTQLAQAYRELGAAGATTNEIIGSTPDILEFATAALIDMNQSAGAVLATAKSFNIALSESGQIVDAYTQAMNQGALSGQDFQWIMGSVGAVAKMAGQDFREILSVGSAMRDSGVQAQDAGTSIKAALLQLINPTKEAQKIMKDLGINVYDTSGKMKQWSEITAEFERALAPFNEQSRNLVMTTVLGSDGIRAMATSMNKGSGYLRGLTQDLKNSEGATNKMASAMADTFDGAIKRTNASLERAKVLLFEDFEQGALGFLQTINIMVVGFNNVDEGTRRTIELLVGAMGLAAALGLVAATIRFAVIPALQAMGITASVALGPWGLLIGVVTTLTGAFLASRVAEAGARAETENHNKTVIAIGESYIRLDEKLNKTKQDTTEYKALQGQVNSALQELARQMPEVISAWDAEGDAIAVDNEKLRENLRLRRELAQGTAKEEAANAQQKYDAAKKQIKGLEEERAEIRKQYEEISSHGAGPNYNEEMPAMEARRERDPDLVKSDAEAQLKVISDQIIEIQAKAERFRAEANKQYAIAHGNSSGGPDAGAGMPTDVVSGGAGAGDESYVPSSGGGSETKNLIAEAAKAYTEAINNVLLPYRAATEAAASAVGLLGVKEQYLSQVMESGQGTAYQAIELAKVRAEQTVSLSEQQEKLSKQADAERLALVALQSEYSKATDPDAAKELRQEIENLTQSTVQLSQSWWKAEQQKLSLLEQVKQEERRHYDGAYQQAMDLMRHQVTMAQMSTGQQIKYLERLRERMGDVMSPQQKWGVEEDLFRLYRQQLSDYLDELEGEYNDKLDAIDAKTKRTIDKLQSQIDALDEEDKSSSREEALRQHNEKLKELQEKRFYHEQRTGKEHQKAIGEINKEMAEENRQWELQQQEWQREDKKEALEQQIEDARDVDKKERERLEEHYRKATDLVNKGALDTLAALAAKNKKWLETGKNWIKSLMEGIDSMEPEFRKLVKEFTSNIDDNRERPDTSPDVEKRSEAYPYRGPIAKIIELKGAWDAANKAGNRALMDKAAEEAKAYYSLLPGWIAELLKGMDYTAASKWEKKNVYHEGGIVTKYGPQKLSPDEVPIIAKIGEYILPAPPPKLVDAYKRTTSAGPGGAPESGNGYVIQQVFNAPLYNSERTYISDETDAQVVAREVYGLYKSASRAKG